MNRDRRGEEGYGGGKGVRISKNVYERRKESGQKEGGGMERTKLKRQG